MTNTGVKLPLQPFAPKDYRFDFLGFVGKKKLVIGGDWRPFAPVGEHQRQYGLETMGCVSYSNLNCHEFISRQRGDVPENNWSDRALAKMSGTTQDGNWLSTVAETVRKLGLIREDQWGWKDATVDTWDEYYSDIVPATLATSSEILKTYDFPYEWVPADPKNMTEALEYGPLQVCNTEHAFVVTFGDGNKWYTFDTYGIFNGTLPWDYKFEAAMIHYEVPKAVVTPPPLALPGEEGCRYFVSGGTGRTVFYLAGKFRYDDLAKCLDQWIGRNDGELKGKGRNILESALKDTPIYDLKGNPVVGWKVGAEPAVPPKEPPKPEPDKSPPTQTGKTVIIIKNLPAPSVIPMAPWPQPYTPPYQPFIPNCPTYC